MHTVVIGAGAAFHLARAGAEVTVIDAHLDGRATAAAGATILKGRATLVTEAGRDGGICVCE